MVRALTSPIAQIPPRQTSHYFIVEEINGLSVDCLWIKYLDDDDDDDEDLLGLCNLLFARTLIVIRDKQINLYLI